MPPVKPWISLWRRQWGSTQVYVYSLLMERSAVTSYHPPPTHHRSSLLTSQENQTSFESGSVSYIITFFFSGFSGGSLLHKSWISRMHLTSESKIGYSITSTLFNIFYNIRYILYCWPFISCHILASWYFPQSLYFSCDSDDDTLHSLHRQDTGDVTK